ncbi:MAG: HAD family hydrolase [Actinomycetota bacterium]
MARPVRSVIFDMDGTLIDSFDAIADAYGATVDQLGGGIRPRNELVAAFALGPPGRILAHLLGRPVASDEIEVYHRELSARAPRVTLYPNVGRVVEALSARVPLAVFSGASTLSCEILLRVTRLRSPFGVVLGSDHVERPKPEPDGIELTCERVGVPPESAAYVGDSPDDMAAARRAGVLAVAAAWGELFDPQCPADVVVSAPEGLLELVPDGRPG